MTPDEKNALLDNLRRILRALFEIEKLLCRLPSLIANSILVRGADEDQPDGNGDDSPDSAAGPEDGRTRPPFSP